MSSRSLNRLFAVISGVAIALLLPWGAVYWFVPGETLLTKGPFLEEYAKFLGSIVGVFLSFSVVHLLWQRVESRDRARRAYAQLLARIPALKQALTDIEAALDDPLTDGETADAREKRSARLQLRLERITNGAAQCAVILQSEEYAWIYAGALRKWFDEIEPASFGVARATIRAALVHASDLDDLAHARAGIDGLLAGRHE